MKLRHPETAMKIITKSPLKWLFSLFLTAFLITPIYFTEARAQTETLINEQQAKAIALKHAQISDADLKLYKIRQHNKGRDLIYNIVFLTDMNKYVYEINVNGGDIIAFYKRQNKKGFFSDKNREVTTTSEISLEDAETVALKHAGISKNDTRKFQIKQGYHKNRPVYEVEFTYNGTDYEYEIDRTNGEILEWEID